MADSTVSGCDWGYCAPADGGIELVSEKSVLLHAASSTVVKVRARPVQTVTADRARSSFPIA